MVSCSQVELTPPGPGEVGQVIRGAGNLLKDTLTFKWATVIIGGWLVAWFLCCFVALLLGCLFAWLLGCLVAWLLGCLVAWLLGCLVA